MRESLERKMPPGASEAAPWPLAKHLPFTDGADAMVSPAGEVQGGSLM